MSRPSKVVDLVLSAPGVHFLARQFGPLKARAFDARIRSGWAGKYYKWDPELVSVINEQAKGGRILVMGCGTGAGLDHIKAKHIQAVDVSPEAVKLCKAQLGRNPNVESFSVESADMEQYWDSRQYNAVCFLESIYYIPQERQWPLLDRLRLTMMERDALFITTFSQAKRYSEMISALVDRGATDLRELKTGQYLIVHR